ncbi:unnamed protein product [Mytilus edulis]|uniref:3'-5' exoribonuclease HELZ2 OB-fold domain-containing protein n=1 Tax=Mytilus edulis TaxID=6550 RepID=A0A8S3TRB8_MYTED|nr:unnamed protein product [Mytilus edulis]
MDSDSDDDWYDEVTNRRRNLRKNINSQQDTNTVSLHETPESWFHEGLQINRFEFIRSEKVFVFSPFLYRNVFSPFDESKYTNQPKIYKKCIINILSMEEAVCIPEDNKQMEIIISGREKCGQTYTEDTVYVKVSNEGEPEKDKNTTVKSYHL